LCRSTLQARMSYYPLVTDEGKDEETFDQGIALDQSRTSYWNFPLKHPWYRQPR